MSDEYLWDRSGPPDPEIERLEKTLAPLSYRHRPEKRSGSWRAMAAVAATVLAAVAVWRIQTPPAAVTAWQVSQTEGAASMGRQQAAVSMAVRVGQVLRTGVDGQLRLRADDVGRIDLGPNSEMRASTDRQISLERGTLHAFIWAPPREFVVDTPSARAVDLGCEYTIQTEASGDGLLRVQMGWVAFQFGGNESFIPAGAQCVTHKRQGIGIPFYEDAPEGLRQALVRFERGDGDAVGTILSNARERDGLTLWHLLTRVKAGERGAVYDRLAALVKLPAEASREGVLRKDAAAIDACWNALNLENAEWWRGWERKL